ncbi:DUF805 domain-containing protein [Acidithiobacillus sp. CV18-2]|uniref:DUF805 domain-containing protein n=2 Tax=Igneacidithiobacillus copahuensis TaxID=2724909 RepID=A0AAE3CKE4_9PROT|nr:DUF805 domain-containing protein [Acidithiobacillus sp. CV18-3]MBU2758407.1 DUF805 domain-containing protein [Acidithiobacillus sp. BN09-2]MBU2776713.1 DUF805 domain-containing protein [Acidithiobacillus sp. CV18-2]MBU2788778.1 DUF805 domain-containing protein [Igneacidithiobacillus copahuensis]MBU2795689.1 DUF805 domain-containing protein [Acidithiobacillus sp. VAN18-2]MBU2799006.1 DUF805 domain-containing protein [Acidithiobacillus sp. VAN18-4]UTV81582.1 DUF805 domain-containing protein 
MIDAYTHAIFHNYARFDGRMSRAEYWWFALFNFLIFIGIVILGGILGAYSAGEKSTSGVLVIGLYGIYLLATFLPNLATQARRLHDVGLSAWLLLLYFVPYIGSLALLIITIFPARPAGERFGPYYDSVPV